MQINKRKLFFHWFRSTVSILLLILLGILCLTPIDRITVKAANKDGNVENSEINQYKITYHSNGGNGTMSASTISSTGGKLQKNVYVRSGYTFQGWSTTINGTVEYKEEEEIFPTSDLTLFAVWEANQYTVTYHANGGTGTMEASVIPYAGANLRPNSFTRTGYTFAGWAMGPGEKEVIYNDGIKVTLSSDITLYAVWIANQHSVTLNQTGEGASGSSDAVSYGLTVTIHAGTKEGYCFAGWTTSSQAVQLANASDAITTFLMPDEDVSLTANWKIGQYQVFLSETGEGGSKTGMADYQSTVTLDAGKKEGYTFAGWEVEAGTVTLADATSSVTSFVMGMSDVKIKALWQINTYTVTITDGGTGSTENQHVAYGTEAIINAGKKDGSYFCGWEIEKGLPSLDDPSSEELHFLMPASDVVLNATWKTITGVSAGLNDQFHNTYGNDTYMKNGRYNVNKNITLTKEMTDVTIQFSDGSSVLAKDMDYDLKNALIHQIGTNSVEIVLTAGNTNLNCQISLEGYSPELDAVMEKLGLAENDYNGLAAKVEQLQTKIGVLTGDIAKYEQNLVELKQLLLQGDISTDLSGNLEERLQNTQNSVKEAIKRLSDATKELTDLRTILIILLDSLGVDKEQYQDYENLSEILKELQKEIDQIMDKETILIEEMNQIADKLGISDTITNQDDLSNTDFFEKIDERLDDMKKQLDSYKGTMEELKTMLDVEEEGSLQEQLKKIAETVEGTLSYLNNLQNQVEQQLKDSYGETDTEGMSRLGAILTKIRTLQTYADNLKVFHDTIEGVLGLESNRLSYDEIYQIIIDRMDKLKEYDQFLDQTEGLIQPDGVNGSSALVTGEQTKEELGKVYEKIEDMGKQMELLEETLQILLEKETISIENTEELKQMLALVIQQKERADRLIDSLKNLLEIRSDASDQEIYNKISAMKDTMSEYWNYLKSVEGLLQIEDNSHLAAGSSIVTGPAVTVRLTEIYNKLMDMVKQQNSMEETVQTLLEKETIQNETIEELKKLIEEMLQQKKQTDQFLTKLKDLLGLDDTAKEQEVITTITNMKEQLNSYIEIIEDLLEQLGMSSDDEEKKDLSEQLKEVFHKILELTSQLEAEIEKSKEAEQTILSLKQMIETLINENHFISSENGRLQKENEEVQEERKKLQGQIEELQKQNEEVQKEKKKLQEQMEELQKQNKEVQKEKEKLQGQVKELQKETEKENKKPSSGSGSSGFFEDTKRKELELKNQLLQNKVEELEKSLQSQAKEIESQNAERKQILDTVSDRDKQIKELQDQIALLNTQLKEKETSLSDLQNTLEKQRPLQELLEQNQIDYKKLIVLLNQKENSQKLQITKETTTIEKDTQDKKQNDRQEKNEKESESRKESWDNNQNKIQHTESMEEESTKAILEKETKETIKTAVSEPETSQTEENTSDGENLTTDLQVEQQEEKQNEFEWNWIALSAGIIVVLVLAGAIVLVLSGREKLDK